MTITFDKKIYDLLAVKNAIKAYKGLADFDLKTNKNKIMIKIDSIDKDLALIFKDEFCNYILSEIKKIKLQ